MPLSSAAIASNISINFPSLPTPKIVKCRSFPINNNGNIGHQRAAAFMVSRSLSFATKSLSGDRNASVDVDVPFPSDYPELLDQARKATDLALKDNRQLMEIEFPTAGLQSVPGDGEGGIEMTGSMQLIREFCDGFINPEKATRTRIFQISIQTYKLRNHIRENHEHHSFSRRPMKLHLQESQPLEEPPLSWTI